MRSAGLLAAAVLVTAGCGGGDADGPVIISSDGIAVLDAWVRPTPPTADEAAFYVTVENRSASPTAVIGASSPACMVVLPHATTFTDDGVASMGEALDQELSLDEGERVTMEPNGLHLMCLGLAEPLATGSTVEVVLELSGRDPVTVEVAVEQR